MSLPRFYAPRHQRCFCALVVAAALATAWPVVAVGQTIDRREATLEERLTAGLQARRPSEREFIDAVVDTVDRGELPEGLVDRFFQWSRLRAAKRGGGHRAIIYFEAGLRRQADKLRIRIEADEESAG